MGLVRPKNRAEPPPVEATRLEIDHSIYGVGWVPVLILLAILAAGLTTWGILQ